MNDTLKAGGVRGRIVDATLGSRLAAVLLGLAGIGLLWWTLAGIILIVTGLALLLISRRDAAPGEVQHVALLRDLGLQGPGHHVPTPDGVRLFIPASPTGPYLVPEISGAVQRDPPGSLGLALDPPGLVWLERWRDLDGLPTGQGIEEATLHLARALPRLGLARAVHVAEGHGAVKITMRLRDPQPARDAEASGWHMQGGCAVQSFACSLAALGLGGPVRTKASRLDDDGTLHVEVVLGKTA